MRTFLLPRALALLAALLLVNCAQNPVTGRSDFVMISEQEEISIGRTEDPKVTQEYGGAYNVPALQQYVEQIGQKLAAVSHRPNLKYSFKVIDSPMINAFALPGGYVYITRGILNYLNSEAELAAVLGHEIGHVTARHSVQQISTAQGANIAVTIASILVPGLQNQAAQSLINLLGGALLSGYGREHELEADRLGAEYLARAGYDPQAMIRVIGVLKNQELYEQEVARAEGRQPRAYHGVFASHPSADQRLQQVVGEASKLLRGDVRDDREGFLRRVDRLPYGDSPEQGFLRNGRFYHPGLGFVMQFPRAWKVTNRPDRVLAQSPRDDARIELRMAGEAQGSPADVLRRVLRLSFGSQVTPTSVNGLPAALAETSIQGRPTRAATVFHGGNVYLIVAQALTGQAMAQHQSAVLDTVTSFATLSDQDRRLARPHTVRVITAPAGITYAALVRTSPIERFAEQTLRLLNGHYPTGEPAAEQPLKIVE